MTLAESGLKLILGAVIIPKHELIPERRRQKPDTDLQAKGEKSSTAGDSVRGCRDLC